MADKELLEFIVNKVSNLTSSTDIYKEGYHTPVEVVEYSEDSIGLQVAQSSCQNGHLIEIEGTLYFDLLDHTFSGTGKIENKSSVNEEQEKIEVKFHTFDKKLWENFLTHLRKRQDNTDELFIAVKGKV